MPDAGPCWFLIWLLLLNTLYTYFQAEAVELLPWVPLAEIVAPANKAKDIEIAVGSDLVEMIGKK